jgi:hypothetical protein
MHYITNKNIYYSTYIILPSTNKDVQYAALNRTFIRCLTTVDHFTDLTSTWIAAPTRTYITALTDQHSTYENIYYSTNQNLYYSI